MTVPKAGSSSILYLLQKMNYTTAAYGHRCTKYLTRENITKIVVLRDPFKRYISGIAETLQRILFDPNKENGKELPPRLKPLEAKLVEKVPGDTLFDKANQLVKYIHTPQGKDVYKYAVSEFARLYNGRDDTFNLHLLQQMPFLRMKGRHHDIVRKYDKLWYIEDFTKKFETLLHDRGLLEGELPNPEKGSKQRATGSSKLLNFTELEPRLVSRLCDIPALDYCCMNLAMPPLCLQATKALGKDARSCKWVARRHNEKYITSNLPTWEPL